ncbi:hypothetical protein [Aeromonas hydrophila]|nr:hypothetical protein [Aeromonas hydrophila]
MAKGDAAAAAPLIESGNQGIIMTPFLDLNNAYLFTENFLSLNE